MARLNTANMGKALRQRALDYPETTEEFPWGESAFKVKGKTFVFMRFTASELNFSVKLQKSRVAAPKLPGSEPTHYGLGAKGWVTLNPPTRTSIDLLYSLIDESYRAVAPKRVLAKLKPAAQ